MVHLSHPYMATWLLKNDGINYTAFCQQNDVSAF